MQTSRPVSLKYLTSHSAQNGSFGLEKHFWKLIIGKGMKYETGNLEFLWKSQKKKSTGDENKPSMNETDKKVA